MEKWLACLCADAMEGIGSVSPVMGRCRPVRERFSHGAKDGVHRVRDHMSRQTQRSIPFCEKELPFLYLNVKEIEIAFIQRLIGGNQILQCDPGCSYRTPVSTGIHRSIQLISHVVIVNRQTLAIQPDLYADRDNLVQRH